MNSQVISHQADFDQLCEKLRSAPLIAFDTEFVSDAGYRPKLALMQFATDDLCVAVDALAVSDLSAWWQLMASPRIPIVVHGGQAEIRFCVQLGRVKPEQIFDVQIAEGFRCRSYPLSYSAIVARVLDLNVHSNQTRTDWTRRPLSDDQISYALEDVSHLIPIWRKQERWLTSRGRLTWAHAEFQRQIDLIAQEEHDPVWSRISGLHKLTRRDLEAAKRLALWREEEAARSNRTPRRVLRDDLLIDLARRRPTSVQQALHTRDLNRPEYRKRLDTIVGMLSQVNSLSDDDLGPRLRNRREDVSSDEQVIARLLALALANRCAELEIAQTLVGTNRDLNDLVRFIRGRERDCDPILLTGWRNEICGELLKRVLDGQVSFRVSPRGSSTPLIFDDAGSGQPADATGSDH